MAGSGSGSGSNRTAATYLALSLFAVAASGVALWYALALSKPPSKKKVLGGGDDNDCDRVDVLKPSKKEKKVDVNGDVFTPVKSNVQTPSKSKPAGGDGPSLESKAIDEGRALHRHIEEIDRKGKALFKAKKYMEAADAFTEALDLIEAARPKKPADDAGSEDPVVDPEDSAPVSSLTRQVITLTNNRSAMYEKASHPDLALDDCDAVLLLDVFHTKARTRRLRVLESQSRHTDALVEVCALQLKYMHDNRDKFRLGLQPSGPPPVAQSKIEELVGKILPGAVAEAEKKASLIDISKRALPSNYTVVQLLKSFSGYNRWMSAAARGGTAESFTGRLDELPATDDDSREDAAAHAEGVSRRAGILYGRGRRRAFDKQFAAAVSDFDEAYSLIFDETGKAETDHEAMKEAIMDAMGKDEYVQLLEWVGMGRHLRYDLDGALECYERCSDLEPTNTELLVKRAGVKMDGGKHNEADALFESALGLDPNAADALLHRANLRMLQQNTAASKSDLERCLKLYPDNLLARLRFATVLMATENIDEAQRLLDEAETYDPNSSEVHCYRGEMYFAKGEFVEARSEFDRAAECDGDNPTPFVNAALAVMNTPPTGGAMVPDVAEAVRLLEQAIKVDPMFHAAYAQLGQLKLSMATDLLKAREVVGLYDGGLEHCRTAEELKEICSMRLITVAQIDAAHALNMETLNMQ